MWAFVALIKRVTNTRRQWSIDAARRHVGLKRPRDAHAPQAIERTSRRPLAEALLQLRDAMPTSSDSDSATELLELPELAPQGARGSDDEGTDPNQDVQEPPTQPIALFELPPSKG